MQIEDKLIIAKLMDKIKICKTRNKIVHTEFLSIYEKQIIQKELNRNKIKNYIFFGGYEGAEGEILVIYPEKLGKDIAEKNLENILKAIKIKLPKELEGEYNHRDYLGCVMKTGLNRNRIGDIIVHEDGAYIIVLKENAEYIAEFLKGIIKFSKSQIEVVEYYEIKTKEIELEEKQITVASMRLDNIVAETIRISRSKTEELIKAEKVFINTKVETKGAKNVGSGDVLAIRGKGKFIIGEILGNNKKGKMIVEVKKYK